VLVEHIAQISHHVLPYRPVEIALTNADACYHDGIDEHYSDVDEQQMIIPLQNSIVKEMLSQEWIDKTEQRRNDNGNKQQDRSHRVWFEGQGYPFQYLCVGHASLFF
jgi:hypothetical protein